MNGGLGGIACSSSGVGKNGQQTEIAQVGDLVFYFSSRHHGYLPQGRCPIADSKSCLAPSKGSHQGGGLLRAKHQVRLKVVMEMEGQMLPRRVGEAPLPPTFRPTLS